MTAYIYALEAYADYLTMRATFRALGVDMLPVIPFNGRRIPRAIGATVTETYYFQ